jgi:hypothetical protein
MTGRVVVRVLAMSTISHRCPEPLLNTTLSDVSLSKNNYQNMGEYNEGLQTLRGGFEQLAPVDNGDGRFPMLLARHSLTTQSNLGSSNACTCN